MSKRLFLLLTSLLVLALLVAACGTEPEATEAPAAAPQEEEAAEEETAEEEAAEEETAEEAMEEMATCEDALGCVTVASGDPIKIASALVIAGPNETLGIDSQRGVEIAIAGRGEVAGHALELVANDGGCSAEGGQTAATKIASDESIVAVVGHNCSSSCTPAAGIYNDAGLSMISPSCTAPALTGEGSHVDSLLRTAHNDNIQGRVMAEFVYNELSLTSAATIHDGSPYAEQLQQVFADVFVELGGTITAQEAVNVGDTDMRPVLTSIATGGPEFLYYPIFIAEGGFVTTQAKEVTGLENTVLAGADGMISPDFIAAAGDAAEGMYISGPDLGFTGSMYEGFLASHQEMYGEDPLSAFHAHAFDAANLIFDAVEAVAATDADGNTIIGRQALRDALYATSGHEGITGSLSCNEMGDCADPQIAVNQIQAGEYVPVSAGMMMDEEAMGDEDMGEMNMVEGCDDALGCVTIASGDPVKIASALVIAGPNETLGIDSQRGVEIAIADQGEVAGHSLELVAEDGGCSAEGGQTAATKIASDESIVAVVGHNCSSSCTPAAGIYNDAGLTMISPSCTAPALTGEGSHVDSLLRTAHNDNIQGRVMAEFVYNELSLTSAATIHDGSPYAEQLQQVFADVFVELGGTITAQEAINVGDTDMRPVLTSIATGGPEFLYYPIFIAEGGFVTTQAKEISGLEDTLLAGADGMISPDFIAAAGDAAEGMYISGPDLGFTGDKYQNFLASHQDMYGEEPLSAFHAHAYDAASLIFAAIETVAGHDADGNLIIGRQALRDALYDTSGHEGITGSLSCNEMGDCADPQIAVNQIQGGDYVPLAGDMMMDEEAMDEEAMDGMMMELAEAGLNEVNGLLVQSAGDCSYGGKIGQIEALDDMTVEFTMCSPDPAFLSKAAFVPFYIQPREWIEETGGEGELLERPIGTGPYILDSWNRGDSIIFTQYDDYWGEAPIAETLVFRWSSEAAARLLELQAGTVDQITNISPDDYETVQDDPNLQLLPRANPNTLYLAMTNTFEPFNDVKVRQAIAMGIDRQRIVDNFYAEGSQVANYFTPCSIPNGCVGDEWYDFDPEGAKALLAEAGYPDGFETSIFFRDVVRVYLPEAPLVAVEFQNQLKENLNIDAEVVVMESGEFIAESQAGNLDGFYLLGWGADYLHVTNFLDFHFSASNPQFGDPHPEVYEQLEQGSTIGDLDVAEPFYVDANNAIRELVPMVPIAHGFPAGAARADVENAHTAVLGPPDFWDMDPAGRGTLVWMKNAEPIGLWCADQSDGESLDACTMVTEGLYQYDKSGNANPTLATSCDPNEDSTVWTCHLREGVTFHDGSSLDANDVVMSWAAGIDASNPYHKGSTGDFTYFSYLWDDLMNQE